jgi:1-acyl-sn-glycerol-3-phosphate acyltransferase
VPDPSSRPPRPSLLYLVIGGLSWPLLRLVFRQQTSGVENVPRLGGCVLAANHWSNLDPWPLAIPVYPRRFLRFMAKSELFWPPLGWFIKGGGGFKVRRGQRDDEAMAAAARLCREGHVVVMFPEGTRRRKGMRKKYEARWHTGAARIALEADVPLIPAGISGTERVSRLARIKVAYGPAVDLSGLGDGDLADRAAIVTERLRLEIERLELSLA